MVSSWGNYPRLANIERKYIFWQDQENLFDQLPVLPYGQGRSYGDSCLNEFGILLDTTHLNRMIAFNHDTGVLRCESGITLSSIMQWAIPQGWMLPVVPGTQFVSVGGAIANDVHGKNHHKAGTFGCHVRAFELLRSDGSKTLCSLTQSPELFTATIGGLGLTGLILWAEIQLMQIPSPFLQVDTIPFYDLNTFMNLSRQAEVNFDYIVAWIDCQAKGKKLGRGLFMQANYLPQNQVSNLSEPSKHTRNVPCFCPSWILNHVTISTFNELYFWSGRRKGLQQSIHYQPFFFPLDNILYWNRIYGRHGFLQYQCVIPLGDEVRALTELLKTITRSGQGSFLSVLKSFGNIRSPGLLSFPQPGITLALDFAFKGQKTLDLLNTLDKIIWNAGGRLYPAKDARMSAAMFHKGYPDYDVFAKYRDHGYSSSFSKRVMYE